MAHSIYRRLELIPSILKKGSRIQEGGTNEERIFRSIAENQVQIGKNHQTVIPEQLKLSEQKKAMREIEKSLRGLTLFSLSKVSQCYAA